MFDDQKISIILPIKNGDKDELIRAINSIYAQEHENFELLLIDDGSEADFAAVLDEVALMDERIKLHHISPSGVSGARNYAIDIAEGDVITFLDGDDTIRPFAFNEALALLKNERIDGVIGGTCYISYDEPCCCGSCCGSDKSSSCCGSGHRNTCGCGSEEGSSCCCGSEEKTAPLSYQELKDRSVKLTPRRIHKTRSECIGEPYRFGEAYINRGIAARFLKKRVFKDNANRFPVGIRLYEDAIWNLRMFTELRLIYVESAWYDYYENNASVSNSFNKDVIENMELPLSKIRKLIDMKDAREYRAYTRVLVDSLRYIYKCLYGHPDWKPSRAEKKAVRHHLFKDEPWAEIGRLKYLKYAEKRDKEKAVFYRFRLIFLYWRLRRGSL